MSNSEPENKARRNMLATALVAGATTPVVAKLISTNSFGATVVGGLLSQPKQIFQDAKFNPLIGGQIFTYAAGTLTPKTTYQDAALTIPNANPTVANANGEAPLFGSGAFRIILKDSAGSTIYDVDNVENAVTLSSMASSIGAALTGYSNGGTKITVEQGLDVLYFGIANIKNPRFAGGATGDGTGLRDVAAFDAAVASGIPNIYIPAGIYGTTATRGFLFGNQSRSGQSAAPITLLADGWGTVLKAMHGFSGTVLQGWSLAGVRWGSFAVDGNNIAHHCIDTDWKAGVGPSLQNYYSFIRCYNAVGDSIWRCWDNNDARFDSCISIGTFEGQKGFDLKAGGGLFYMNNCIWDHCYMSIGAQNGVIRDCWGFGIMFAGNAVNYISISGGYIYSNSSRNACLWSESFSPFQSAGSLVVDSTQFVGGAANSCFFDLNLYSGTSFSGCQFISSNSMNMWGKSSRSDSYSVVKNLFKDGEVSENCARNTPSRFLNEYDAFMNASTRRYYPDERYSIYAEMGQGPTAFAANIWYDLSNPDQFPPGTYKLVMSWDHNGSDAAPFYFTTTSVFTVPKHSQVIAASGAEVIGAISEFNIGAGTVVKFRLASDGVKVGVKVQFSCNKNLNAAGTILTRIIKEA